MLKKHITKILRKFKVSFLNKFKVEKLDTVETFLMLVFGHLFNIFTPNQLANTLNIGKSKIYKELKKFSIHQIRRMFTEFGTEEAAEEIRIVLDKSAATKSRYRITIGVDDTVVERIGKEMALTYGWYSGRWKKVLKGQNIIAITMKIGDKVIPIGMRLVAKQGRKNTSKPEIFVDLLEEVIEQFKERGIDLTQFPISFDSWYSSLDLVEILQEKGFEQIVAHTKSNFVFTVDKKTAKLSEHKKEIELKQDQWGCGEKRVARKVGKSPTFGKVVLVFYEECSVIKCLMAFGRKLRACEMMSIWSQHHGIEEFWRALKSDCQIKKMRPISRQGTYLACAVKLLSYVLMKKICNHFEITIHKLKVIMQRKFDLLEFFVEHFHILKPKEAQIRYG